MSVVINIAVSVTISTGIYSEVDLPKQIADIDEISKQDIFSEIQSDYCVNNIPYALSVYTSTDNDVFIKDINTYVLFK